MFPRVVSSVIRSSQYYYVPLSVIVALSITSVIYFFTSRTTNASIKRETEVSRSETTITSNVTIINANTLPRPNSTCIFILSTPGSGSSTMVDLVSQCNKECEISGENWGALQVLSDFHQRLQKTENQKRPDVHAEIAWKKLFDYDTVQDAERDLVYSMFNPNQSKCWGFKEIRYGRLPHVVNFAKDIEYLSTLCENPKFILHSRENAMKEKNSSVIGSSENLYQQSVKQHHCFNSYTKTIAKDENGNVVDFESVDGCVRDEEESSNKTRAFRFFLEDYLNENENYKELWKHLECDNELPSGGSVAILTVKKTGDSQI